MGYLCIRETRAENAGREKIRATTRVQHARKKERRTDGRKLEDEDRVPEGEQGTSHAFSARTHRGFSSLGPHGR